jgi:molybdopterin converting factor small subunit
MTVSVNLLGFLRDRIQADRLDIPLENKMCVGDVLSYMQEKYPGLLLDEQVVLVTVNQHISSLDQRLRANDEIVFIPHIGGG